MPAMPLNAHGNDNFPEPSPSHFLTPKNPGWPELWRELPDPPSSIHVAGCFDCLSSPSVAIVGTRRATGRGLAMAQALASALAIRGWVIVSGLALGIDAAAHRGALDVGGKSVGVMATGIDRTYPAVHRRLRRELESDGCCLTEFPPGTNPRKFHFPRRNRLIAGLAQAVIVVEAPLKSGALSTAYLALDYNREVFAVPGPVDMESSRGCHHLLREGAHLLETADDLHAVLAAPTGGLPLSGRPETPETALPGAGSAARWIFDRLNFDGITREQLRCQWAGSEEAWSEGLLALELAGLIRRLPGGALARRIW